MHKNYFKKWAYAFCPYFHKHIYIFDTYNLHIYKNKIQYEEVKLRNCGGNNTGIQQKCHLRLT